MEDTESDRRCSERVWLARLIAAMFDDRTYKGTSWTVTFNVDPPKIGSSRNTFFWNIWTHSEKFVPTIGQPHETKPVTTKDISGVHSCISRKMNDCFSWVCLSSPTQCSKRAFVANLAQCMQILSVACGWEWDYSTLRAAKLTGLSSFQKHRKPHRYASGPNFASEICWGSTFFSEGVHILQ